MTFDFSDRHAPLLKSIFRIAKMSSDFRSVYCAAVWRIINADRRSQYSFE